MYELLVWLRVTFQSEFEVKVLYVFKYWRIPQNGHSVYILSTVLPHFIV